MTWPGEAIHKGVTTTLRIFDISANIILNILHTFYILSTYGKKKLKRGQKFILSTEYIIIYT